MKDLLARADQTRRDMGDTKLTYDHMLLAMGENRR